jgi:adenylate cyclase class 2
MNAHIEVKFLNVEHDKLRGQLEAAGGRRERPLRSSRRILMDYPDGKLWNVRKGWLRIRDEGYTTTLTYKQPDNWSPSGVRKTEVVVNGLDAAKNVLEAIGMEAKAYQESRQERWHIDEAAVILNEWPYVRPFCELEGEDEAVLQRVAVMLGLPWEEAVHGGIEPVYLAEYDITIDEFHRINDLTFVGGIPQLLQSRQRQAAVQPQQEQITV